jgi:hypothetical protein
LRTCSFGLMGNLWGILWGSRVISTIQLPTLLGGLHYI